MIKINLFKLTTILTLICFISSCAPQSTGGGGGSGSGGTGIDPLKTNGSCDEPNKSFTLKYLGDTKKPNEDLRIKILAKTIEQDLEIKNEFKYPIAETVEHQGIKIIPSVIKTMPHTAISKQEAKKNRKELWKDLRDRLKVQYKLERAELKKQQKQERVLNRDEYHQLLKLYEKNTSDRKEFINEQINLRQSLISDQKEERSELKEEYKAEIEELRNLLNNIYPKDKQPLNTDNPFEDVIIDGVYDDTTNYNSLDVDNSYEYDNTYVDGKPYTDSNQSNPSIVTQELSDYELDSPDQTLIKTNVDIGSCVIDEIKVEKKDDQISLIIKKAGESCDFKSLSFDMKTDTETPFSVKDNNSQVCGQEQTSNPSITYKDGKITGSSQQTGIFTLGVKAQMPYNVLDDNKNLTLTVVNKDNERITIDIGKLTSTSQGELGFNDINVTNQYTVKNIRDKIFSGMNSDQVKDYIGKYRFGITNISNKKSKFSFLITDDANKNSQGYFNFTDPTTRPNTILLPSCPVYTPNNSGFIFEFDKTKMKTGKYNIFLLDSKNNIITDNNYAKPKKSFFVSNLTASTYAINSGIIHDSEEARVPVNSGNNFTFEQRMIVSPKNLSIDQTSLINTAGSKLPSNLSSIIKK